MGRVNWSLKQRVPVAPQNDDLSLQNFFFFKVEELFLDYLNVIGNIYIIYTTATQLIQDILFNDMII